MRYLAPALFREGPTDTLFLGPIILRLLRDLCWSSDHLIELPGAIRELRSLADDRERARTERVTRAERIVNVALDAEGEFDILFVHSDGSTDPGRALAELVEPGRSALVERLGALPFGYVPVVPVRETEAWALADIEAIERVIGRRPPADLLPTRAADVEAIADPKARLTDALTSDLSSRRRRKLSKNLGPWLDRLSTEVSLDRLRGVPSFAALVTDTRRALEALGVIT